MRYRLSPEVVLCSPFKPPWPTPGAELVVVRPGKAFPPSHPTTRLCLDLLREALAVAPVRTLADIGCGTGILGLAAAALGVPRVVGADLSREAVRVTRANARANQLARQVQVVQGSTECLRAGFDLVVANLPFEVQLAKVPELLRLATPQGRLILSGFRDNQEEPLLELYQSQGWVVSRRVVKDFWHPELPPTISFTWVAWLLEPYSSPDCSPRPSAQF